MAEKEDSIKLPHQQQHNTHQNSTKINSFLLHIFFTKHKGSENKGNNNAAATQGRNNRYQGIRFTNGIKVEKIGNHQK